MCMHTVTCTQHIHAHTYTKTDIIFGVILSENNQITKWKVGADSNNMSAWGCTKPAG